MWRYWSVSTRVASAVTALFAVYFPVALWLQDSYVPSPKGPPGAVFQLTHFRDFQGSEIAFVASNSDKFDSIADQVGAPTQSPMLVYEDNKPLGLPHSMHEEIRRFGKGRFSHWKGTGFIISTSDNSDPNTNGRKYWVILPASPVRAPD
jgi:hypothetical protein